MQLIIVTIAVFLLVLTNEIKAQVQGTNSDRLRDLSRGDSTEINIGTYESPDWRTVDVDFLSSFYAQDGNNGAVTGGIGTEQLTDFTQKIILSVPVTKKLSFNADAGYDYYTSASTDNIDNIRSSDSKSDTRVHGNFGVSYDLDEYKTIGGRVGGSVEYDYYSISGGLTGSFTTKDKNTSIGLSAQAFFDTWDIIYPKELRGDVVPLPTDKRRSYNASVSIARVLTKRMQVSVQAEAIYMEGLLSTPFHRVYFQETEVPDIERLPDQRLKIPLGIRFNAYLNEKLLVRTYYRYYWDSWGMQGHTASLEFPVKLNRFFSVYPYYRFHTQNAVDYFKPYKEHSVNDEFYTSDHDLSALSSHSYGLGLSFSPSKGVAKVKLPFKKHPAIVWKSIDFKYGRYHRSTGLNSHIVSLGLSFSF